MANIRHAGRNRFDFIILQLNKRSDMSAKSREVYFHVGLPKTASTFLQRRVFPYLKGICYYKKHDFKKHLKKIDRCTESKILLSYEFNPHPGDKDGDAYLKFVSEAHVKVFPIIVFRKHSSWLSSRYKYHIRKHGTYDLQEFIDETTPVGRQTRSFLQYHEKITYLEKTFGHPPLVLFQEEIKHHPFKVINAIAGYTGANFDENDIEIGVVKKAYPEKSLKWVLRFNRKYRYAPSKVRPRILRKLYKKISQLFLHTVAFAGKFFPDPQPEKSLIQKDVLARIDREYQADWEKCKAFARKQREVFLPESI